MIEWGRRGEEIPVAVACGDEVPIGYIEKRGKPGISNAEVLIWSCCQRRVERHRAENEEKRWEKPPGSASPEGTQSDAPGTVLFDE